MSARCVPCSTTCNRRRILQEQPDILLTTPESSESMLVSTKVDARRTFAQVRVVVVDEVHAFAGNDRGWHLLCVLERLSRVAGRPLQRVGLSRPPSATPASCSAGCKGPGTAVPGR